MKMYNNGPRKAMMYGGMSKRKPVMYGGMATKKKKPRKKAQAGGMMSTTQKQQQMQQNAMPMMAGGGKTMVEMNGKMVPDYAADGKGKNDLRKKMNEGGKAMSDRQMMAESGKAMSDADRRKMEQLRDMLETMSDQDKKLLLGMISGTGRSR